MPKNNKENNNGPRPLIINIIPKTRADKIKSLPLFKNILFLFVERIKKIMPNKYEIER